MTRNKMWMLSSVILSLGVAQAGFLPLGRTPDRIEANGAKVETVKLDDCRADVFVTAEKPLEEVVLEWECDFSGAMVLGDHWERMYGDGGWRPVEYPRAMPWFFLCKNGGRTDGYGVMTQPNAFASWRTDGRRLRLLIDVRAAGRPVQLNGRRLKAVTLVSRKGTEEESAFAAGRAFCRVMCPKPRLSDTPIYGYNDWYCAYGKQTAEGFLRDAKPVLDLCKGLSNRPVAVVDDGWQRDGGAKDYGWGPWAWRSSSPHFGMDMKTFCGKVAALGARPGLWYRPLVAWPGADESEIQLDNAEGFERSFDPTVPSVVRRIKEDIARFRDWGVKVVKIDFLSVDLAQAFPCDSGDRQDRLIKDSRRWRDDSRTSVEVVKSLYQALRDAAGTDIEIIGCNALNHLAAGLFECQRTGDDTSGRKWATTRMMGVNALAMRAIQNGTFFQCDPDCVGLAERGDVPWGKNGQWLDAVARSGQALFVSWKDGLMDDAVRVALRQAFRTASDRRECGEPLDWEFDSFPRRWRFADGEKTYDWNVAASVADFCARAEKGERLKVVFLGGSLTWGANASDPNRSSWRARIADKLENRYPNAHFKFVDAAIGGTGSELGVFRVARDVLAHRPDLVFVDCTVNDDAYGSGDDKSCAFEGVVRQLMDRATGCGVVVPVILPTRKTVEEKDVAIIARRTEHLNLGKAYSLACADVLGELSRLYTEGRVDLDRVWPKELGDDVHPHDWGYGLYADIVWDEVFAKPSEICSVLPEEWSFAPKYRHVVRFDLADATSASLPAGWHRDFCSVRAGTFDFLCSRWMDGVAVSANGMEVAPLKAVFKGEVLLLFGESTVQGATCDVFVDGVRVGHRDTAEFGKAFAPSAYLVWQVGNGFDADREHELEIRPFFDGVGKKELRLGSICVAGHSCAWVKLKEENGSRSSFSRPVLAPREQGLCRCQVHRGGGASTRPDNSLETFLWCWGHGVAPEADARLTKDGVAIAFHDPTLRRIARGIPRELQDREIKDMTWDEIKDVDVGSYMGEEYSSTRIATIESVFAAMKGRPERLLYLDEKGAPPALVAELAEKFGVVEQVYYTSPVWQRISEWRKIAPNGRSMVWLGAWAKDNSPEETARCEEFVQKRLDEMAEAGFDGIDQVQLHIRTDLSKDDPFCPSTPFLKRAISLLHSHGVSVQAITWTEGDNPDVYRMLWDVGFDTFATDYPYALFGLLNEFEGVGSSRL